jgi:hypothetical protein
MPAAVTMKRSAFPLAGAVVESFDCRVWPATAVCNVMIGSETITHGPSNALSKSKIFV